MRRTVPVADRLRKLSSVDVAGCWIWQGRQDREGYGHIVITETSRQHKTHRAHRVSYATFVGPIPDGMTVDHLCFVPSCINPEHLRLLTPRENRLGRRERLAKHGHEKRAATTTTRLGG